MISRFKLFSVSALVLSALATAPAAHATTLISIGLQQAGVNGGMISTVATDGGSGSAIFSGSYGSFNLNTVTSAGAPVRMQGNLSSTSLQISNVAPVAGTIYVYITETGLTSPLGATSMFSSFTANSFTGSASSVVESTFFSNTNTAYGGTQLASQTFTGMGTGMSTNVVNLTGTYSETVEYAITVGNANSSVNDTIDLTATAVPSGVTPEPSSIVLLGTGLVGMAGMVKRRFS